MSELVECYSGSVYAERPTALTWLGQRYTISEILSQGRTPRLKWFRVRTEAGQVFELSYIDVSSAEPLEHEWQIHQF
jgi:hypothetical protein